MRGHFLFMLASLKVVGLTTGRVTGTRSIAMPKPDCLMTGTTSKIWNPLWQKRNWSVMTERSA